MKKIISSLIVAVTALSVILASPVKSYAFDITQTASKKGLQGADSSPVYEDLGVNNTLYNINITDLMAKPGQGTPFVYGGETYYFNYPYLNPSMVTEFNTRGVSVSVVLLMTWNDEQQDIIYSGARQPGHTYYALNPYGASGKKLEALFTFLAQNYCTDNCHIDNWILGNEVNMPNHYNYTGTTELGTNVEVYADSFVLLYRALKGVSDTPRAFISLDHSWTHNDEGRGIAGKDFLDRFNLVINQKIPECEWNLAYHAYAPIMTDSRIWAAGRFSDKTYNSMFISGDNIEVLTEYVKNTFGSEHRIILSEQGFTAAGYGEDVQAAAIAYTYYKAEFNDMIDAVIFRSLEDEAHEVAQGFKFGLIDGTSARKSYEVFKYMDTAQAESYTSSCLSTIGITSWDKLVPGYNASYFINRTASSADTGKVLLGKYAAVFDPEYYLQNNPDVARITGYDYTAAIRHFQSAGMNEGRRANEDFDPSFYRADNPDLAAIFGNEWWRYYEHYITHGLSEGRRGH